MDQTDLHIPSLPNNQSKEGSLCVFNYIRQKQKTAKTKIHLQNITDLYLPCNITAYNNFANELGMDNLKRIHISQNNPAFKSENGMLLSKDGKTFISCPAGAENADLPETITKIERYAFHSNKYLKTLRIPDNVTELYEDIITCCPNLKTLILPLNLKAIHPPYASCKKNDSAKNFEKTNPKIERIIIPENAYAVTDLCFISYTRLNEFYVEEGNKHFSSFDGVLYNKDKTVLLRCPTGKTSVKIADTVQEIGKTAFQHCSCLTEIILPYTVRKIAQTAFAHCDNLRRIAIASRLNVAKLYLTDNKPYLEELSVGGMTIRFLNGCFSENNILKPHSDRSLESAFQMLETKNWSARIQNKKLKQAAVMSYYLTHNDTDTERCIQANANDYLLFAAENNCIAFFSRIISKQGFLTKSNINSLMLRAHELGHYEIYSLLLQYKDTHYGYPDIADKLKL